eukprot:Rhum_TRINITY_DN4228_c0_g2::Rhum_TRINITY_DN4228_c0_g2_i1::g.13511::m.13511
MSLAHTSGLSHADRAAAVHACEEARSANLAREQAADCLSQNHVATATAAGVSIEADIGRLTAEIKQQAQERAAREAAHNSAAVNPYRYRDATHSHVPSAQFHSYY